MPRATRPRSGRLCPHPFCLLARARAPPKQSPAPAVPHPWIPQHPPSRARRPSHPPSPQPTHPARPAQAHVAVAGLNPHSGERGQLGREEEDVIGPWLESQRAARPRAWLEGPLAPDTMWVRGARAWGGDAADAEALQPPDAYLATYHDQGVFNARVYHGVRGMLLSDVHAEGTRLGWARPPVPRSEAGCGCMNVRQVRAALGCAQRSSLHPDAHRARITQPTSQPTSDSPSIHTPFPPLPPWTPPPQGSSP